MEKNIPTEGIVGFQYYAGEGSRLQGCKVVTDFRRALLQLVLVDERDLDREEEDYDPQQEFTLGETQIMTDRKGENIGGKWLINVNYYSILLVLYCTCNLLCLKFAFELCRSLAGFSFDL